MNAPETTRPTLRAALAINGARAARRSLTRTRLIARQLDAIAPGTVHVRTVPVWKETDGTGRRATWVVLDDALGLPIKADADAHRAARGLLARMFPATDWTRPHAYDALTGELSLDEPAMPAELAPAMPEEPHP
ncbi:hypothetical protein [Streptomyces sp. 8L]|uniref:hypothetical protein n=1 Tax=Streptomyces sp. 8L TaxID=2877242 RepID=UPI001CD1DF43|nr:hypothetical protein [Streptomyces sp. 8L]MCA1218866.1 hypothetical protein [Streptomyces sp. 8L]